MDSQGITIAVLGTVLGVCLAMLLFVVVVDTQLDLRSPVASQKFKCEDQSLRLTDLSVSMANASLLKSSWITRSELHEWETSRMNDLTGG
jgi:ABC-type lipoprotein release transport system permease subunit